MRNKLRQPDILFFENYDIRNIITPVKVDCLERLLTETRYDQRQATKLIQGFKKGFPLGYKGNRNTTLNSPNLEITVGSKLELWNKVMKEVKEKRYAGPFSEIPFKNYIQSPIGLVPKDGGKATRLIFHLSYPRTKNGQKSYLSVNANVDECESTVHYPDFSEAINLCLNLGEGLCYAGKSDLKSAFRHLPIRPEDWPLLVMKAESPIDGKFYFFIDKCLPFGASISCAHFQSFSNALSHIVKVKSGRNNTNYLDDFFFVALQKFICDQNIQLFLNICREISFPVSLEKTFWGTTRLTFLGLLIDTELKMIFVPLEKINKALDLIEILLQKKKGTVKQIQRMCGIFNFFTRCVIPARTFTRRLYSTLSNRTTNLQPHHHVNIPADVKMDLELWKTFLQHPKAYARPFSQFSTTYTALDIDMFTDSSANPNLGCGGVCENQWFAIQ